MHNPMGLPPEAVARMQFNEGQEDAAYHTLFSNFPSREAALMWKEFQETDMVQTGHCVGPLPEWEDHPETETGFMPPASFYKSTREEQRAYWDKLSQAYQRQTEKAIYKGEVPGWAEWMSDPLGIFRPGRFTMANAVTWGVGGLLILHLLKGRGPVYDKPDNPGHGSGHNPGPKSEFKNEWAARQLQPRKDARYARKEIRPGVSFIYQNGKVQSIRFKKERFTAIEARDWLRDHELRAQIK